MTESSQRAAYQRLAEAGLGARQRGITYSGSQLCRNLPACGSGAVGGQFIRRKMR